MEFRSEVEPPEPMRGLEVPPEVVESLGEGKRPRVIVTLNGHTWHTRIAILRGRYLIGLSNANRTAAGVAIGDQVDVQVEVDSAPMTVVEPEDFVTALDGDPAARAGYDSLTVSQKKQYVRTIEQAKKPETRVRRIEKAVEDLRDRAASRPST